MREKKEYNVSWLSRGPDLSGEVWIGCKRLILKLSEVLLAMEVKGPYMHANRRLTLCQVMSLIGSGIIV